MSEQPLQGKVAMVTVAESAKGMGRAMGPRKVPKRLKRPRVRLASISLLAGLLALVGCAPAGPAGSVEGGAPTSPRAPRTITLSGRLESVNGLAVFSKQQSQSDVAAIFHAGLTTHDAQGNLEPRLASKVPSVADGDWKVNPDGSMSVTWKLRPNARWHDGAPLIADDFVFGLQLAKDKELPIDIRYPGLSLIQAATAPDADTVVVQWSSTYIGANEGNLDELLAVPRRLVGDLYSPDGDKSAFINSPYWTTQFVGLGPYRLGQWEQGSFTEGLAFDSYFLGRPKIDRVVIRYITDPNVTVTALLSGQVDVAAYGSSLSYENLSPVRTAWEPTGAGSIIQGEGITFGARLQYRDPGAQWASDVRVRQALVHLLDRQSLADTFAPGSLGVADLYVAPAHPSFALIEQRGYAKFPYDQAKAAQLLGAAGWTKGPNGVFQNASGSPFAMEVRYASDERANSALVPADMWKQAGLDIFLSSIATTDPDRSQKRATAKGAYFIGFSAGVDEVLQLTTAAIRGPENNWLGANPDGYSSPFVDRLYAQYSTELDAGKRLSLYADFMKFVNEEAIDLPNYYTLGPLIAFRAGVRGPVSLPRTQLASTWNIHDWEIN